MQRIRCRHGARRTSGQSLLEFAIVIPVLFMMLTAVIEFGIVFNIYNGLTNAAREAARAGSMYQYDPSGAQQSPCASHPATTPDVTLVDCERGLAMDQVIMSKLNPLIKVHVTSVGQLNPPSGVRYTYTPSTSSGNNGYRYGDKVTVTLSYTHQLFFNLLGFPSLTMQATSEMRIEPGGR